MLVLLKTLILPREGNEQDDCGGEWTIVRRHRDSRKKNIKIYFNTPGARSHSGEGFKFFESPLGRAGPRPQSGFSTVSVSSPVVSPLDGAVGPHAAGEALFDEECRSDPAFRSRVLGLERMLRVHAKTVPASKVVGAGVSVLDRVEGACLVPRASLGTENTFVDGAGAAPCSLPGEENLGYSENDLVDDAESVLGGRDHPAPSTAGESSGISGLLEVSESVSPLHVLPVINSLNSSLGVDVSACACAAAAALPAVAAPRSWSTVARLSDAVVAPAHASPTHRACSAGGTGGFLPVQKSTSYCLRNSGFPAWPKICVLSQMWRQGLIFGQPAVYGSRLQVPFPGGNQAQVPGVSGKVRSHLPSTRSFLVSDSCHLDADWTSRNRWAGRRCVELHDRGFGC